MAEYNEASKPLKQAQAAYVDQKKIADDARALADNLKEQEVENANEVEGVYEELTELTETSGQNSTNICRLGGMPNILNMIVSHDLPEIRQASCRLFSAITSNNKKVQQYALKAGAVNLAA